MVNISCIVCDSKIETRTSSQSSAFYFSFACQIQKFCAIDGKAIILDSIVYARARVCVCVFFFSSSGFQNSLEMYSLLKINLSEPNLIVVRDFKAFSRESNVPSIGEKEWEHKRRSKQLHQNVILYKTRTENESHFVFTIQSYGLFISGSL